ncbi:B2L13 protein, partial [Amia calva]|nr:B2L13 protein [Amia calva]
MHLHTALQALLSAPLDYQRYKEAVQEVSSHSHGWNKVLVPLVLLQSLMKELTRQGEQALGTLLPLGVQYLEEAVADYIIQQGGWGTVFSLEEEEDQGIIAEDSNDIYILTSDNFDQLSPPESLVATGSWQSESLAVPLSASQSWHTSLGPESWAQVTMDPEDIKSLDSNGGGEERSENNSSNSDIVHVEKEEITEDEGAVSMAEILEVPEVPEGVLKELESEPLLDPLLAEEAASDPALEEPAPPPSISPEPLPTPTSTVLDAIQLLEADPEPPATLEEPLVPAVVAAPLVESAPPPPPAAEQQAEEKEPDVVPQEPSVTPLIAVLEPEVTAVAAPLEEVPAPAEMPLKGETGTPEDEMPPSPPDEIPVLLYGGAAVVAIVAVVVVAALAYRKK